MAGIAKQKVMGKIIAFIVLFFVGMSIFAFSCGWFSDGLNTVQKEYSPSAMLKKYEWFKNQSQFIVKAQQDIANLKSESGVREQFESDNGKVHSAWPPIVQKSYQDELEQNKQQRLALISNTNKLIADYNAQASKFNWASFKTRDDLPPMQFESVK